MSSQDFLKELVYVLNLYTKKPAVLAALLASVAAIASTLTCFIMCVYRRYIMRKRRRENALAVRLAETAPVNDDYEHEIERRVEVRSAAPAGSAAEEESEEESAEEESATRVTRVTRTARTARTIRLAYS